MRDERGAPATTDMTEPMRIPLLGIVGPTASGKSAVGMALARSLDGEIVSADSMQVYRGMDIGTAKPSRGEQAEIRHHLIDVADPDEVFSGALSGAGRHSHCRRGVATETAHNGGRHRAVRGRRREGISLSG